MRIHLPLTLALLPAALVAQSPVTDYAAVLKAEAPAIDSLLKEFQPEEALKKAESLLPSSLPAFDSSSTEATVRSSNSFAGLARLYHEAAIAAVQSGDWEKGVQYLGQAGACADANLAGTKTGLAPLMAKWNETLDKDAKFVAEHTDHVKAILAKPGRTAAEEQEWQTFVDKDKVYNTTKSTSEKNEAAKYLQKNQPHFQELDAKVPSPADKAELETYKAVQNELAKGPGILKNLQNLIDADKADCDSFATKLESGKKNIQTEKEEQDKGLESFKVNKKLVKETSGPKFEEKKSKYYESILNTKNNYDSRPDKRDRMNFLFRLRHHVAGTPLEAKVSQVIERVRQDKDPLAAEKGGKGKKAK